VVGIRSAGQFVGNTIVINPLWNWNLDFCSEIPQVAPPNNLLHIKRLQIIDFIGNELLQFLNVSRRLFVGCWLRFPGNYFLKFFYHIFIKFKISTISNAFIQCNSFGHFSNFSMFDSVFNF